MPEVLERVQDSLTETSIDGIPNWVWAGSVGLFIAWLLWRRGQDNEDASGLRQNQNLTGFPVAAGVMSGPGPAPVVSGTRGDGAGGGSGNAPCPPGGCPGCPGGPSCGADGGGTNVGAPITIPPPPRPAAPSPPPFAVLTVSPVYLQAGQYATVQVSSVSGDIDEYEIATAVSNQQLPPGNGWSTRQRAYGNPPAGRTFELPTSDYEGYQTPMWLHVVINLKKNGQVVGGGSPNVVGFNPAMHYAVNLLPRA